MAAGLPNEAVNHGETQPGSLAAGLGGEKRFERAFLRLVTHAFAGIGNPAVVLLDWETGRQARMLTTAKNLRGVGWGLNFHPGGFLVGVMGGNGGFLLFWKADADDEFHQLKLKQDARGLDLRPDGMQLAVAHYDNRLRTYDLSKAPAKQPAEKK